MKIFGSHVPNLMGKGIRTSHFLARFEQSHGSKPSCFRDSAATGSIPRANIENRLAAWPNGADDQGLDCVEIGFPLVCQLAIDRGDSVISRYRILNEVRFAS